MECAQLVKANSIEGCKKKEVYVVYTRWRNLHKTADMQVGAIGYHDRSKVHRMKVEKNNSIVNALNRTKTVCYHVIGMNISLPRHTAHFYQERFPDLASLQQERAAIFRAEQKAKRREELAAEKQAQQERQEAAKLQSYE